MVVHALGCQPPRAPTTGPLLATDDGLAMAIKTAELHDKLVAMRAELVGQMAADLARDASCLEWLSLLGQVQAAIQALEAVAEE